MSKVYAASAEHKLKEAELQLASVIKHAYVVIYVDNMLRSEREDCTFLDALQSELRERDLMWLANEYLAFERFRSGMGPERVNHVEAGPPP